MAENGQSTSQSDGGPSGGPRGIASLAKKPSDVTRQGTHKLKFVPTLPARRKKEEVKQEAPSSSVPPPSERGNGRGRGRGRGRGNEGRGAAPRPPPVEMTASGPFAMGPALAGTSARRAAPRSNYTPVMRPPDNPSADKNQTKTPMHTQPQTKPSKTESDEEVYSEPDEGVEIIDMDNVRQLDWMAPETLEKDRREGKKKKLKTEVEEVSSTGIDSEGQSSSTVKQDRTVSSALNLNESEEEQEDLVEDFAIQTDDDQEEGIRQERLYFFQFPEPFPTFVSASASEERSAAMDMDNSDPPGPSTLTRKVSFAADVKLPATATDSETPLEISKETPKVDGVIGQLEMYRSGAVKMRLGNGILLHISEGTQPSFLQQAVHLDIENNKLHVLGEVNKRFVVSPDLETLLAFMEHEDRKDVTDTVLDDTNLIKMDTS